MRGTPARWRRRNWTWNSPAGFGHRAAPPEASLHAVGRDRVAVTASPLTASTPEVCQDDLASRPDHSRRRPGSLQERGQRLRPDRPRRDLPHPRHRPGRLRAPHRLPRRARWSSSRRAAMPVGLPFGRATIAFGWKKRGLTFQAIKRYGLSLTARSATSLHEDASHASSATGQLRLLLYIPERSKQQGRRSPAESFEMATPIRFTRVSARLPEVIQ